MGSSRTIALLGGGQLGRMFIENALRFDVQIHVLDPDPEAPCARIAHRFTVGDLNDKNAVIAHAKEADVVGIEIEHVNVEALVELKRMGKTVIPDPEVLRTIKDKGLQKQFYVAHGIPTAPFAMVNGTDDLSSYRNTFSPAFLKTRSGGYDGKGVLPLTDVDAVEGSFQGPCIIEQGVDVDKELAVLIVRSAVGEMIAYDPVEMVFDPRYNLVDHLRAPARLSTELIARAKALAGSVANAFNAPGLYAVELFLTNSGELLVNETAPRAHNSGHHTIEACASSQFDQLLRVYMGWPLGDPALRSPAAMINLVGEGGEGPPVFRGLEDVLQMNGAFPHFYGKARTRTGRKMGHITVTAPDHTGLDEAIAKARRLCHVEPA